jgi:uncharacterized protein
MKIEVSHTLDVFSAHDWNALASPDFPFADYEHLSALEKTGCASPEMGWLPIYLTAKDDSGHLIAAAYTYVKSHGYGEFVFDHIWERSYAYAGLSYYPKLIAAVPYTPANGPKVLVHPLQNRRSMERCFAEEMKRVAMHLGCSSVHSLFIPYQDLKSYEDADFFVRYGVQFHWNNRGYSSFDDFLGQLKQKRRRQILLERRQLQEVSGLEIVVHTGEQLVEHDADLMAELYLDTNEKWGSIPCLNKQFFRTIFRTMSDRIVLFIAKVSGEPVAAALNFMKGSKMFGRYWGTKRDIKHLHFELCYYQAIDFCIKNAITVYEAGAQGEHKIPRGFTPQLTYSMHALNDSGFCAAAHRFVLQEKNALDRQMNEWRLHSAYKEHSVDLSESTVVQSDH